jgi:hypothetical protein
MENSRRKSPSRERRAVFIPFVRTAAKAVGILVLSILFFLLLLIVGLFAVPEVRLSSDQIRWLSERFLPEHLSLEFESLEARIIRPEGRPFARFVQIDGEHLCVIGENQALRACFTEISIAASAGWGGERLEGESPWRPRLISIEPIWMLGGDVEINLPRFPDRPAEDPVEPGEAVDFLEVLRGRILPKWDYEGSRVVLDSLRITTEEETYVARFDLVTGEGDETLRATLHELSAEGAPLSAKAEIRVFEPEQRKQEGEQEGDQQGDQQGERWRIVADGDVRFSEKGRVRFEGDSRIETWQSLEFRIGMLWQGVAALREARIEGDLKDRVLGGKFSLKLGAAGAGVRAIDFVNCRLRAEIEEKTGSLRCGPQTVRVEVPEVRHLRRRGLYTFEPEFELRATRIAFGETLEADLELDMELNHLGIFSLTSGFTGGLYKAPDEDLRFVVQGDTRLTVDRMQQVVELLRGTPYAVPAPFNVLDGPIGLRLSVDGNERLGRIGYDSDYRLDSKHQSVHLRSSGETSYTLNGADVLPVTRAEILIDRFHVSAPRFDLRLPPQFAPDPRFGRISPDDDEPAADSPPPMDFELRVRTTRPQAIRIATNLTQTAIPVDLDLTYRAQELPAPRPEMKGADDPATRSPASLLPPAGVRTEARVDAPPAVPVRGWVRVGRTPIEVFRRQAVVQDFRLDFLESGERRMNGVMNVSYLDYDIHILLLGRVSEPQVRLTSTPVLEDEQIISVLLFGRPLEDLDNEQRQSVTGVRSAFANAALGLTSLYLLANTPIESIGYDPERDILTARVGLGGGTTLELGGGGTVGIRKRLARNLVLIGDVERIGATGQRTVSALVEWVRRF